MQEKIPEAGIKKKRRSKLTALEAQKFKCGCGKAYLSYAALFTHLKNVHQKQTPKGTIIPAQKKEGNRGRPKVFSQFPWKIGFY